MTAGPCERAEMARRGCYDLSGRGPGLRPIALLALLLPALTACHSAIEAPTDFDELLIFLFDHFDDEAQSHHRRRNHAGPS